VTLFWKLFGAGATTQILRCNNCHCERDTVEEFTELLLPFDLQDGTNLGNKRDTTLGELMENFTTFSDGDGSWLCTNCFTSSIPEKSISISQFPHVLCILIKRIIYFNGQLRICNTNVDFPMEYFVLDGDRSAKYDLMGGIFHKRGRGNSGHYTAICNIGDKSDSCWITYDDDVFLINDFINKRNKSNQPRKEFQQLACFLFYERNFDRSDEETVSSIETRFSNLSPTDDVHDCTVFDENFSVNTNEHTSTQEEISESIVGIPGIVDVLNLDESIQCMICQDTDNDDRWGKFDCSCKATYHRRCLINYAIQGGTRLDDEDALFEGETFLKCIVCKIYSGLRLVEAAL